MTDKPKRRWYQYSLRTLFVLMTLVAIACSWYAWEMNEAAKRRAAIQRVIDLKGAVKYYDSNDANNFGEPPGYFAWLRKLHGDERLGNAVLVGVTGGPFTDDDAACLESLTGTECLILCAVRVTDAGMGFLEKMTNVKDLSLQRTDVTDACLIHLKELTALEVINLMETRVADEGLVHLKGLTNLRELLLSNTQVTDSGLRHLGSMKNLRVLALMDTQVTDAGIARLKQLENLEELYLQKTQVTQEGVEDLRRSLPNCDIWFSSGEESGLDIDEWM